MRSRRTRWRFSFSFRTGGRPTRSASIGASGLESRAGAGYVVRVDVPDGPDGMPPF